METIPFTVCTKIGFLQKPHGVQGALSLIFQDEFEISLEEAHLFLLNIDGGLVPFFIEEDGIEICSSKKAVLKFKWIDTQEKARELTGCEVWLKGEDILQTKKEFSFDDFVGFQLFDDNNQRVGEILDVDDFSGNVVFTVDCNGKSILIPFNENLTEQIDQENKRIFLTIPDGLLASD